MPNCCTGSSSTGALTVLAAIGAQDAYLTINPEITFFRCLYKRHTNYAWTEQDVQFCSAVGFDRCLVATYPRAGDLVSWTYFRVDLTALALIESTQPPVNPATDYVMWTNAVGNHLVKEVSLSIGNAEFDKLDSNILYLWEHYNHLPENHQGEMIGEFDNVEDQRDFAADPHTLYIFLPFWYARHCCLSLPLIALQYHDVRVQITTRKREDLIVAFDANGNVIPLTSVSGGEMECASLLIDYIYLDTQERRVMAQQPHEFLFSQWQIACPECIVAGTTSKVIQLYLNHPITDLITIFQYTGKKQGPNADPWNFGVARYAAFPWQAPNSPIPLVDPFESIELKLNGHDYVAEREASYFRNVTAYQGALTNPQNFLYLVKHAPICVRMHEDEAPGGTFNASRIDNLVECLHFAKNPITGQSLVIADACIYNYAKNFNVMKVAGGMAAARFAN